eukprot:7818296-Pyramimonas_sp.AAC.1
MLHPARPPRYPGCGCGSKCACEECHCGSHGGHEKCECDNDAGGDVVRAQAAPNHKLNKLPRKLIKK